LGIVPVSSETEDKFEDAMEVMASSPLHEIARVPLRFKHVASRRPDTRKQATHELNSNAVVIASCMPIPKISKIPFGDETTGRTR
jgi:hypothetical protein